jgi:hypothetical protein
MTLTVIEPFPILEVLTQVNFFSSPEAGFCLFIKSPDVVMLNGKEHKAIFVLFQNRFLQVFLAHFVKRF